MEEQEEIGYQVRSFFRIIGLGEENGARSLRWRNFERAIWVEEVRSCSERGKAIAFGQGRALVVNIFPIMQSRLAKVSVIVVRR